MSGTSSIASGEHFPAPSSPQPIPGRIGAAPILITVAIACGLGLQAVDGPLARLLALTLVGALVLLMATKPLWAIVGLIAAAGFSGTLTILFDVPTGRLRDLLLFGIWLAVVHRLIVGPRQNLAVWPAALALLLFGLITLFSIPFADSMEIGVEGFRTIAWPMSAVLAMALYPWTPTSRAFALRGFVVVAAAAGTYAIFREIVGPSADEAALAASLRPGVEDRLVGSFPTANHLALFAATAAPVAAALVAVLAGKWRVLAGTAALFCIAAVLFTGVRTGAVALVVGMLTIGILFQLAIAFPGGKRTAAVAFASLLAVAVGGGAYALAVEETPGTADRYERILTPSQDYTFNARTQRWELALQDMADKPFGRGLGAVQELNRNPDLVDPSILASVDSSYLLIGLDQGPYVMALFALGLLALGLSAAIRGIRAIDSQTAALAIGAVGALATLAVFFYGGSYITLETMVVPWLVVGIALSPLLRPANRDRTGHPGRRQPVIPSSG